MSSLPTKPTRQFAFLNLAPIDPEKVGSLRAVLDQVGAETQQAMRGQPPAEPLVPFERLETIHYARFVIVDRDLASGPLLAFSTNYDGPQGEPRCSRRRAYRAHRAELLHEAGAGLERIYAHCRGFRAGELGTYLDRHRVEPSTFYVGSSGRSVGQVRAEAELRQRVNAVLDAGAFHSMSASAVREHVRQQLDPLGTIPPFPPQPDLSAKVTLAQTVVIVAVAAPLLGAAYFERAVIGASWVMLLGYAGALALCVVALLGWFRHKEKTDPQFQPESSARTHSHFALVSAGENEFLQNQLTHLVRIKPGLLRWLLIRVVFRGLQLLATNLYNRGKLGNIPSIHFARWSLIPDRGVLFFSNFDSSWQSYLGDFIDQASSGLTAVWSNTVGYPRTTWLLEAGSRDASRFLAWTREHQLPTQVWYCAYPGISIVNLNDNTEIRRGLADPSCMAADTWLFRLRAVHRIEADQAFADQVTREPMLPLEHVQGIVLRGYGRLPEARFLLLRVQPTRADSARRWLSRLPLTSAADSAPSALLVEPYLNVALSYRGFEALGVEEPLLGRFSTPFVQDSDHEYRARVNGDVGDSAPERWAWGHGERAVHVAVLVYAKTPTSAERFAKQYAAEAEDHGLSLLQSLEASTLAGPKRKEHFGFRDGIAQPTIEGSGRPEVPHNTVSAGEFLLGYRDGYGNVAYSPESSRGFNFGLAGSYLVLRQLEQDVEGFWRFCAQGTERPEQAIATAAKMVGRWPSGAPLVRHPRYDPNAARYEDDDAFSYLGEDEENDRYGARCPLGAHVRRSNPRDWQLGETREESRRLSNLHRIVRRGRPYGPPLTPDLSPQSLVEASKSPASGASGAVPRTARGLHFLCFNASLERQFEFVQQQWCNNPKFAGLDSGADPVLGLPQEPRSLGLSAPAFEIQNDVRFGLEPRRLHMQRFVKTVGSSYLFMPSLSAMKLLSDDQLCSEHLVELEQKPPDEQLHVDSLIHTLREKVKRTYATGTTRRDAHPKMHGCVKAQFIVEPELPQELRVGLFARAHTYEAWVRFSNASGRLSEDFAPDIRGVAIKLLGVAGSKLMDGEEQCTTHDFLLISHDAFLASSVAQFDAFVSAMERGRLSLFSFMVRHPRVAYQTLRSRRRHASVLDISYSSAVPYLLGDGATRYALRPAQPESAQIPTDPAPDYLREELTERLRERAVDLDFLLQPRTNEKREPIEDPTVTWRSPTHKVATLRLLQQEFDSPEQRDFGENLTFNPWRCLPEHRPLGGIGRARRQVYRALSAFRHTRNAEPMREPQSWDLSERARSSDIVSRSSAAPASADAQPGGKKIERAS